MGALVVVNPDEAIKADRTVRVTRCGRSCLGRRTLNLTNVFAAQLVGLREVDDRTCWLASWILT